jgi:hypothetical protein
VDGKKQRFSCRYMLLKLHLYVATRGASMSISDDVIEVGRWDRLHLHFQVGESIACSM